MSTKTQDTSSIQYDPTSKGIYNSLQSPIQSTLTNFMQNPLTSSFFNQRVGMGNAQIGQQQSGLMSNLLNNFRSQGFTGAAPTAFAQSQMANLGRQTSGLKSQNFMNQLFNANQLQLGATGMAQAYQPLFTGSNSTQTTSGTGTWLPQIAGAALGAAASYFSGGAASSGGGGGGFQPSDLSSMGGPGGVGSLPQGMAGVAGVAPGMAGASPLNPLLLMGGAG